MWSVTTLTPHWYHTDTTLTPYWHHTDTTLTPHWHHTDTTLTLHWPHTDTAQKQDGKHWCNIFQVGVYQFSDFFIYTSIIVQLIATRCVDIINSHCIFEEVALQDYTSWSSVGAHHYCFEVIQLICKIGFQVWK